jgi:hypothetical protein
MTLHVVGLLVANLLMLAAGAGLLPVLGLARSRREVVARIGLAYMVGVAVSALLAAHLALLTGALGIDLGFGAVGLFALAACALAAGWARLRGLDAGLPPRRDVLGLAAVGAALVLVAHAARTFAVKPLHEWDGWAIWATKSRALYELGGVRGPVFDGAAYAPTHLEYPLLYPSLQAIDFRVMGTLDGTVMHLQLALLAAGFVGALWALLRPVAWPPLVGVAALAIVAAPQVVYQLSTAYADVPLAFFVALGVAALGAWVARGGNELLVVAALFLGVAALTKNEGLLFAGAAFVAAALVRPRRRLALAALAAALLVAPWRLWVALHDIPGRDYTLGDALDPAYLRDRAGRVAPSARELAVQLADTSKWGLLVPLVAAGLAAALATRRFAPAAFALAWLLLGFGGLLVVYWISTPALGEHLFNSSYRTIVSLVVGGAALVPVLVRVPFGRVAAPPPTKED